MIERTAFLAAVAVVLLTVLVAAPATARDMLYSVNAQWTTLIGFDAGTQAFETAVVNGGSGA